jgi:hypothetical protein
VAQASGGELDRSRSVAVLVFVTVELIPVSEPSPVFVVVAVAVQVDVLVPVPVRTVPTRPPLKVMGWFLGSNPLASRVMSPASFTAMRSDCVFVAVDVNV